MNEHNVPLEAITKGRDMAAVLAECGRIWDGAKDAATVPGLSPDEILADTIMISAYRIYLPGVQDGMKGART